MANQYAQLFQIVGQIQNQVNLCQKTGEPIVGDVETNGNFVGGPSSALVLDGNQVVGQQQAGIIELTDGSGGVASDSIAPIIDVPTANAVASLTAKVNAILAALTNHGLIGAIVP